MGDRKSWKIKAVQALDPAAADYGFYETSF
jgi:hypothetical protein